MFSSHDHKMLPYGPRPSAMERRWKPDVEIAPNCPRCDSSNTKFCYYNNYSLSQPRYFCKDCRRYWTKGGSLRNVPIGGGCRKSRRPARTIKISGDVPIGTRDAAYARQLPPVSTLRPDMALDGMAGSSCQSTTTSSSDGSSDIDLAVLYSKFLNPGPAAVEINADEQFGLEVATTGSSYARMPAVQLLDDDQKLEETSMAGAMCVDNESQSSSINLFVDQYRGLEPQLPFIPVGFGDDIFPSSCAALPGLASHHINPTVGEWTALDQSGFDAFYAL